MSGSTMGSFAGRPLQSSYSGLKVPLLLATSGLICLPNFYVINAVLGLGADFKIACRGILTFRSNLAWKHTRAR